MSNAAISSSLHNNSACRLSFGMAGRLIFTQNQEGIYISELYLLNIGEINDMYVEMQRDEESHEMLACQDDFDRF